VLTHIVLILLSFSALAADTGFVFLQKIPRWNNSFTFSEIKQRPSISGRLENNNGQLRLILANDSSEKFHGFARIALGNNEEQREIGQVEFTLPAQELSLLQISGVNPSGDQYSLSVFDQKGAQVFFKIAPIRRVSDPTPAIPVALLPLNQQRPKPKASLMITSNEPTAIIPAIGKIDEFARVATQVQVQARLLANDEANDSFVLLFELRAQRPVYKGTLSITAGKTKDRKLVSVNLQSQVEFVIPIELDSETINYVLAGEDGKVLANGELEFQQLMADDYVTVGDIRTDRSSYKPGETARMTVMLEGKAKAGYRLEVSMRHGQNQVIFQDQRTVKANEDSNSMDFVIAIPNQISAPAILEFKIYDAKTGLLFDSGEREIPLTEPKSLPKG